MAKRVIGVRDGAFYRWVALESAWALTLF